MKRILVILGGLLLIIIFTLSCNGNGNGNDNGNSNSNSSNSGNSSGSINKSSENLQKTEAKDPIRFISKASADKDFKTQNGKELRIQDFETAYQLGKDFVNDYYSQRSGPFKIDFSKYIVNKNLLKYSNKRVEVEHKDRDIKEISIGLGKAQFIGEESSYYIGYGIDAKASYGGGFGESIELLISAVNGKIVISDWYMPFGAGSSSFDERCRLNESIKSSKIWDNKEYVKKVFRKAGIK
jgi:hypothetical protein